MDVLITAEYKAQLSTTIVDGRKLKSCWL